MDEANGAPTSGEWDFWVSHFRATEDDWLGPGPDPTEPGCRAPTRILREYGYGEVVVVNGLARQVAPAGTANGPLPSASEADPERCSPGQAVSPAR